MSATYDARAVDLAGDFKIARVATRQHGAFTRAQALESGMSARTIDRRLSSGVWDRVYRGVYRLAGTAATWRQSLFAACLLWGEGAVIAHRAGARLVGFLGFASDEIEVSVPDRRERVFRGIVHRPRILSSADVTTVDGIPVTTPARTLIDVAGYVTAEVLEEVLDDALRRRLVTIAWIRWRLHELGTARRRGSALLASLLEARLETSTVPETVFETRLLRVLIGAGLPLPTLQFRVATPSGEARLDFAYVEDKVAIEADGFRWHSSRQQWDNDRDRGNALTVLGWTVIHVTWTQLKYRPDEIVESVRSVLANRAVR